jgi:trk system potassium uptake protein TrkH
MITLSGHVAKYPARASVLWYLGLIFLGGSILWLPVSQQRNDVHFLDCLFTATSAACVTGLTVRSTGQDFSGFGQFVILLLIQIGGIGIMTITTLITFQMRGRTRLRERAVLAETLGAGAETDLRWVLRNVLLASAAFEGAGFVALAIRNLFDMPGGQALWHAAFHSVSAFCNAGFGLFDDNLMRYRGDAWVNLTMISLIVCGGMGFPVLLDLRKSVQARRRGRGHWDGLHLHTKIMLWGTALLLVGGAAVILAIEHDQPTMQGLSWGQKAIAALFSSATCRTAGFNTLDVAALTNATLFLMVLLMMIGGGPCSTAGGVKVSSIATLVFRAWASFRGQRVVNVFRRTITDTAVNRAAVTALLFGITAGAGLTLLLAIEHSSSVREKGQFIEAFFEVHSALGTVGLSTGLTPRLSEPGKVVIMLLMFLGRVGPISAFVALSAAERGKPIEYPQEEPLIG